MVYKKHITPPSLTEAALLYLYAFTCQYDFKQRIKKKAGIVLIPYASLKTNLSRKKSIIAIPFICDNPGKGLDPVCYPIVHPYLPIQQT
jgi:hypothetical protein